MIKHKKRILLFIKVPPPITGATLMNLRVYESEILRVNFNIRSIPISYMKKLDDMGKWHLNKLFKIISTFFKLFYELLLFRPGFVYFQISPHNYGFYRDLIYIGLIKVFRVKILYHLHGKGMKEHVKSKKKLRMYSYAFQGEDVICLSSLLTYDIEDFFVGNIHIVNNGIPHLSDAEITNVKRMENGKVKILYLSNLIRSKGILDFIEALKLLRDNEIQYSAEIVGAAADVSLQELKGIIAQENLDDNITYRGFKFGLEKDEIIANSDVLVFPTKNDVWGNVILEAMQFSIPVIATYEGAIPEIIDDDKTGYLVDKNAPQQIAKKLKILIENPSLRSLMGQAGRKKFEEKYTLDTFTQNMNTVFDKVICNINED